MSFLEKRNYLVSWEARGSGMAFYCGKERVTAASRREAEDLAKRIVKAKGGSDLFVDVKKLVEL